jgi:hypothetical protein
MGTANKDLIWACEKARRAGDEAEWKRLAAEVDKSQEECPHPETDRMTRVAKQDGRNQRIKKDQTFTWCLRCSKILDPPRVVHLSIKM